MNGQDYIAWRTMADAPHDGSAIRIQVIGGTAGTRGAWHREFSYAVIWLNGRWCFASTKAPLHPWQQPTRWRPDA